MNTYHFSNTMRGSAENNHQSAALVLPFVSVDSAADQYRVPNPEEPVDLHKREVNA